MLKTHKCFVFKYIRAGEPAVCAGKLRFPHDGGALFAYNQNFLRNPFATPVDPVFLPLETPVEILHSDILGAIRDASPDYWGRTVIKHLLGIATGFLYESDFLLHVATARIGDLDFRVSATSPESVFGPPAFVDIGEIMAVAEKVERKLPVDAEKLIYLQLLKQGSSLGGSRPKCTVQTETGHLWLAKFPAVGDRWSNARIEGATMALATQCGIQIPKLRIESIHGQDVLLVRRFDREGNLRIGYLSGLSLLGISERDMDEYSYLMLADKLRSRNEKDLPELFRRMVFNVLCRNTDDHPRNHGFLWGKNFFRLAPAFDITPTPSTSGLSTTTYSSMRIGNKGNVATLQNCLSCCGRFGLRKDDAVHIIKRMMSTFASWQHVFNTWNVSEHDADIFRYTFSRWEHPEEG